MAQTAKDQREAAIAQAAYDILSERGLSGLSMLAVAKRAHASNETLYRWYGDKLGLFRALIARNTDQIAANLDTALAGQGGLEDLGTALLSMLLSPRAIALNRAAAGDPTAALGQVLAETGRGVVYPRIVGLFDTMAAQGQVTTDGTTAAAFWLDVLVGDWQVRCVTGAMPLPDPDQISARAARAATLLAQLYGAKA